LSKIDGCIIFDKQMNLHGFGGIIHADQKQVSSVRIVINNIETENSESEFLSLKGTRHRSAFSLAKQNESSLIFVISQDGQVSCYHRAQNTMFISENSW
jgi:DNA integrity scanning protein DisA with diadenylate cyclase activity